MQAHEFSFDIEATPEEVWKSLHPRLSALPSGERRVIEHGDVRIEIVHPGDDDGLGLVRHCSFRVPRYLLSGGVGRSFEAIIESRRNEFSMYEAVGKPLWSNATGWHRLEDLGDGRTRVTFGETYEAVNPILRRLLERRVHRFISADNDMLIRKAVEDGVAARRARAARA
jgi:hypothetical protein